MSYKEMKIRRIINASGRMSILGVSTLSPKVLEAMKEGGERYFVMSELHEEAGRVLASYFKTEAAYVVNSASAGIVLSVAGCIARDNLAWQRDVLRHPDLAREVVLMKGHNVDYGAPVETMVELGGGIVREAGYANGCSLEDIGASFTDETVAFLYIKSHHTVQKNMPSLGDIQRVCEKHGVPLIVDAAAEDDLTIYSGLADLVIYSGSKALEGPTSGVVAGKAPLIAAIKAHAAGIGRAMKIGKEAIFGLVQAVADYADKSFPKEEQLKVLDGLKPIGELAGVTVKIVQDEAGREIFRARVMIDESEAPFTALEVVDKLAEGEPAIFTRDYHANVGHIDLDARPLLPGDAEAIVQKFQEIWRQA